MIKKLALFTVLLSVLSFTSMAQQEEEEEGIDIKTLAFGATTSNYTSLLGGVVVRSSIPVNIRKGKTVYQYLAVEAVNLKNPREYSQFYGFGPKYIMGKRNYLFNIRPQYGREFAVFQKSKDSNVGLSLIVAGGPSLGFLKPYTVRYEGNNAFVQYNPESTQRIEAVGGLLKNGFRGMKFTPGLHAKVAANIDINTFSDNVTGLEIGTTVESFFKKPEIMAPSLSDNPQTFVSVYLTLYFGNKKIVQPKKKQSGNGID
jgi:hypothetical protein